MFAWVTDNVRVPSYEDLPTEPYVTCNWGDGTLTTDELFIMSEDNNVAKNKVNDRVYNLEHDYKTQGEYSIECSMNNKVSEQSVSHQVSSPQDINISF